jgi:flagellar basal body-associated protein FliL
MDSIQSKSKTKIFIILGVIATAMIVVGAIVALVRTTSRPQTATQQTTQTDTTQKEPVTQQSLQQDMSDVEASVKEQQAAHEAAKTALSDQAKQVKASN